MALLNLTPDRLNQYFDGKRTDDEILYRAEISRKQLREVLHYYDEYVGGSQHLSIIAESLLGSDISASFIMVCNI